MAQRLYFAMVSIAAQPVCGGHYLAEDADEARRLLLADFYRPLPRSVIEAEANPSLRAAIERAEERSQQMREIARAGGAVVTAKPSKAALSQAVNASA